jgi:hypothetical protein
VPDVENELKKLNRRLERERKSRLDAEVIAEKGLRELYEKQQQLQVLEKIAVAANESASVRDALRFALSTVCQYTGWSVGHALSTDTLSNIQRLVSTGIWHASNPERVGEFCVETARIGFEHGEGLPGRVLASGTPAWIADLAEDPNFPRSEIARKVGLRAGFAFPILAGSDVAAVLEFFSDEVCKIDEALLG